MLQMPQNKIKNEGGLHFLFSIQIPRNSYHKSVLHNSWFSLWGNALKRSPGIIHKSRVSYPFPGFLSSATWTSLPKKRYNGLNHTKPNQ